MTVILGIKVDNRKDNAKKVQEILTEYGCSIKTRLGLHLANKNECSIEGLILLEVIDAKEAMELEDKLISIEGIEVQKMKF